MSRPEAGAGRVSPEAHGGRPAGRARHRARSPIIDPGWQPALLTAALCGLLAATAPVGQLAALPAVVLLQAVTAAGWFRLNGMWPARQGILLAFVGGLAADAAVLVVDEGNAPGALLGVLGVWFLLVVVLQLRHRGSGDERLDSLTATSASTLLTVLAGALLAAVEVSGAAVAVGAGAVAAATLLRALPGPAALTAPLGLAAACGVGALASGQDIGTPALALAAAAGACALVGVRVASYDFPSRFVHFTA
ncbi:hypothetical protein RM844_14755, partial [Streptomyces sp. DSM 44915]